MQRKFAFIALACCAKVASAAEVYKWTDAGGVVHYADTEPAAALNAQRLHVRGSGTTEAAADGEAARSAGAADTDTGPQADAAALAGTSFPIDREFVARELGFEAVCDNSLDAVSDRDFAIEFCACAALIMLHLSRFCEELILWMSPRFGFIMLPDRYCTGSSIMPQKKNPDVPELARGKTARVYGHLMALLTLMKGQPLAYNKDNQEDKEPLFDTIDTLSDTLAIFAEMVPGIEARPETMRRAASEGFATATDLADYLVKRGLPFRDAHEVVARAVRTAETQGCGLADLPLATLQGFSALVDEQVYQVLTVEGSLAARDHRGGTAPAQVKAAIQRARKEIERWRPV